MHGAELGVLPITGCGQLLQVGGLAVTTGGADLNSG